MKITKAAYSRTYPISNLGVWEKIFLEAEINEGEDARNVLYDLKRQVENFHFESKGAAEKEQVKGDYDEKNDMEWGIIRETLLAYEFKEDALDYINSTNYSMLIEAKQIINLKPSKNAKQQS